ncbi:putative f-boxlrr-repeat protein [Nicotiana attenuata]|uniref:F-boxlrr-repeat protein n=1 Tax=Nicotiana attenuata TaxID=49451 RepID=A0A1J6KG37_NICAT|nr:putative f-boxlrr-repeat protein [Nicotiana attenuata]
MAPDHSRKHTPSSKKQKVRATGAEKRKKRVTGVEETLDDRIGQLPDSLLIQILSLLPFTTCVLAKRWQYLWTSVDHFIFRCEKESQAENFISFVDYALPHSSYCCEEDSIYLPQSICICSSLITLDLSCCFFDENFVIEWKSLKSLKLKYTVLDDDAIVNNILSGSPALETLEFFNFEGFRRLEINSLNLQRLKFKEYWLPNDSDDHSLEIVAPYIQHLEISKNLYDLKCRLINAASVVSARLTFRITCSEYSSDSCPDDHQVIKTLVQEYFQKLSCATELTIGTWFTEVMLPFEGGLLLPELKCKCLTLDLHITKFYSYGAAILLQASPHVETLNITMATIDLDFSRCKFELGYLAKGGDIHLLSRFGFPNLRNVKVVSSSGTCLQGCLVWDYDELFNLSEFILKNAMGLEKFVLISRRRMCKRCSRNYASQYLFRLAEKLVGCPRCSANSVIICQEGAFHD